jgi:hypothetical protein
LPGLQEEGGDCDEVVLCRVSGSHPNTKQGLEQCKNGVYYKDMASRRSNWERFGSFSYSADWVWQDGVLGVSGAWSWFFVFLLSFFPFPSHSLSPPMTPTIISIQSPSSSLFFFQQGVHGVRPHKSNDFTYDICLPLSYGGQAWALLQFIYTVLLS